MDVAALRKRWYVRRRWRCPECQSVRTFQEEGAGVLESTCLDCCFNECSGELMVQSELRQQRRAQQRLDDPVWWAKYDAHMASPEWAALREAVRKRCGNVCEVCGIAAMVQAHHLNYKRLGHELLSDLLGICIPCHKVYTGEV